MTAKRLTVAALATLMLLSLTACPSSSNGIHRPPPTIEIHKP